MNLQALDSYGLVVILLLVVAVPAMGAWDFRRLMGWLAQGRTDARTRTYRWIITTEWSMTLVLTSWWLVDGRELAGLGLVPAVEGWQWLAVALGLAASLFMVAQMLTLLRDPDALRAMGENLGDLASLGPQTEAEGRSFTWVSITAGVCEEVLYRGALLAVLAELVGVGLAVVLSSMIFGLGHAYQGVTGIAKTAAVGLVLALLAVFSGSLFVAMVLHTVIDLTAGRLMTGATGRG
jgi:membrane protease YdiL (CAAX protease family)